MKFVNKEHFDAFLNCLSFLGQGSQGICYLDSKNRIVYKVLHEYFDEDVRDFEVGIFNLGYLPGGNHECVTQYETTLKTIKKALEHLVKGGCLYVVVYIGHDQGKESTNLDAYFRTLDHKLYNVAKFEMMNKNNSPYVVIIEKR